MEQIEQDDDLTQVQNDYLILNDDEVENDQGARLYSMHGTKLNMVAKKGKLKGQEVIHF